MARKRRYSPSHRAYGLSGADLWLLKRDLARIDAELGADAPREPVVRRNYRGPWLGLYRDPRCGEVTTLCYGRVVKYWRRPKH